MLSVLLSLLLTAPKNPSILTVPQAEAAALTPADLVSLARNTAVSEGVNPDDVEKVIGCESNWDTNAVGDNGTSFGLAQLHYPEKFWGISKEQAEDPFVAIQILVREFKLGHQNKWSCWTIVRGGNSP